MTLGFGLRRFRAGQSNLPLTSERGVPIAGTDLPAGPALSAEARVRTKIFYYLAEVLRRGGCECFAGPRQF